MLSRSPSGATSETTSEANVNSASTERDDEFDQFQPRFRHYRILGNQTRRRRFRCSFVAAISSRGAEEIHQSVSKPQEFFFYEVFAAETAFAAHQQTEHFKKFILGEAIPKLAKRERSQFQFI